MKRLAPTLRFCCRQLGTGPNGITLMRPLGTILFVPLALASPAAPSFWARWGLCGIFLGIVGSDILDGWLARRRGQTSPFGRALDHTCDVLFILTALSTFVWRGIVPWWLPVAIAWAFLLYVVHAWWRPSPPSPWRVLSQQLGHLGGILYYVTTGLVTLHVCTEAQWLSPTLLWDWCLGIALLAGVSGSSHLIQLWLRLSPACRAGPRAETPPQ